jgi:hypothetical protein
MLLSNQKERKRFVNISLVKFLIRNQAFTIVRKISQGAIDNFTYLLKTLY